MTARDGAASIQADAIRITPLTIDGAIDTSRPILTSEGFITASFASEIEEGDEITEKAANGKICIQYKADDSMKGITFNLSVCSPDPEVSALLAGGQVLAMRDNDGVSIEGYTSPPVGGIVGAPVAIELWSKAILNGKPASPRPYWHWVFPYVRLRYDGDREFTNGALSNQFSGNGSGNDALATTGLNPADPADDFVKYKSALANPFSYVRDYSKPMLGWSGAFNTDDPSQAIVVDVTSATTVTEGSPGSFGPGSVLPPETYGALIESGIMGVYAWDERAIGTLPEWVELGDGTNAHWNGTSWVLLSEAAVSMDVSSLAPEAAASVNLAGLKADLVYGDGNFTGGAFAIGQYITLADSTTANYKATTWTSGPAV